MLHHSFSCSLDSILFSCGLDELHIISATYDSISEDSLLSNICLNNNAIYNETLIESFVHHIDSFAFNAKCDVTSGLQSLLWNAISLDELQHHIDSCNISYSIFEIFEIFYYCAPSHSDKSTKVAIYVSLSEFITDTLTNPSNPNSIYWLCWIIVGLLSLIFLCGWYYCCAQCIRCYQYHYFCFHCICCASIINYLCCCEFCDDYNWFYYIKHDENYFVHLGDDKQHNRKKDRNLLRAANRFKYNTVSEDRVSDKLRVSVHSTSSWNTGQSSRKASSLHRSVDTTPIPQENAISCSPQNVVITPIVYGEKVNSAIFNTPASIELSPISQTSHHGIDLNLKANTAHPSSAYILTQIADKDTSVSNEEQSKNEAKNDNDPDLILPSDPDDDVDEEIEMLSCILHPKSSKSIRSVSKKYKRKKIKTNTSKSKDDMDSDEDQLPPTSTRVVFNRSKSNTKHDIALLLQHNADHIEYESRNRSQNHSEITLNSNVDMSNVVMVSYDSSPDIKIDDIIDDEYMNDGRLTKREHDDDSSGNGSPLKLVKAATWNGRTSEIVELFKSSSHLQQHHHHTLDAVLDDEDEDIETEIGLYENTSGHIFSASLEQYPLASDLKTIKEISHEVDEDGVAIDETSWKDELRVTQYIEMNELVFIQLIGRGSNSNIFHGQWKDASVSIKMYDEHYSFKKFRKELDMFDLIGNHPHILSIYGYTFDAKHNTFGIIQQLMSHGSAADAVRKQQFNIVPTLLMMKYACCGLRRMHEIGILHRQFAAKHILLDVSGKCCITNLSEAKNMHQDMSDINDIDITIITSTTPPEVMTNKMYTRESDVYALAMSAWEILTQRTPFEGIQAIDAQIKVLKENERPLQHNIPDDIYLLLNKCWHINPEKRPSLTDIIADLNNKLYKYRLLAKGQQYLRRSSSISMQPYQSVHSIYSASVSGKRCKRPSLVTSIASHQHRMTSNSAPFPTPETLTTSRSPQLRAQRMPAYRASMRHPQLQQYYSYSHAQSAHTLNYHHHMNTKTHQETPISRSTPPPPLDINQNMGSTTPSNSHSYNGVKTPTLPMYSHSAVSPDRGPPQPISPPPNGYNPNNIILAKINSQSAAE